MELSEEEKTFLKMPKSSTDYVKIDDEKFRTNIQVMAAKLRMSLRNQEEKGSQGLEEQDEEAEMASKRVFDSMRGLVDFRKKRVTDMVTCKRIKVPEAAEASKEAKIQVLINNLEDVVTRNGKKETTCQRAGGANSFTTMSKEAEYPGEGESRRINPPGF